MTKLSEMPQVANTLLKVRENVKDTKDSLKEELEKIAYKRNKAECFKKNYHRDMENLKVSALKTNIERLVEIAKKEKQDYLAKMNEAEIALSKWKLTEARKNICENTIDRKIKMVEEMEEKGSVSVIIQHKNIIPTTDDHLQNSSEQVPDFSNPEDQFNRKAESAVNSPEGERLLNSLGFKTDSDIFQDVNQEENHENHQ